MYVKKKTKQLSRWCIPRASWERANAMLKGDMITLGCSGVVSRFCRSCRPSFWTALATASLDCRLPPTDTQPPSCSSSDEAPLGLLVTAVATGGTCVLPAFVGCGVLTFIFWRRRISKHSVKGLMYCLCSSFCYLWMRILFKNKENEKRKSLKLSWFASDLFRVAGHQRNKRHQRDCLILSSLTVLLRE